MLASPTSELEPDKSHFLPAGKGRVRLFSTCAQAGQGRYDTLEKPDHESGLPPPGTPTLTYPQPSTEAIAQVYNALCAGRAHTIIRNVLLFLFSIYRES